MSGPAVVLIPPPPNLSEGNRRWEHLPLAHRQRLLRLLSHLLERQLPSARECGEEAGHDAARDRG